MNCKGQFSIIAALLVAVVLIGTVITTYATLRYSTSQDQPQVLSAIDETNVALDKVLGFTVGYYGSVLQVTGDTDYAQNLTRQYLNDSLSNIADIKPEWGGSFRLASLDLSTNWFTNNSYSAGQAVVNYDLPGLGISGMSYTTSCRLDVQVSNSSSPSQVCLSVFKDESEPLINLGRQNFKFYRYLYSNLTWNLAVPSGEVTAFANGTYLIAVPEGIDSSSFVVQVTDTRGIMVAAASFSRLTSTFMWNTTTALPATDYVDSNSTNLGSQSNFTAQQYGPDSIFDTLTEGTSGPVLPDYYPSSYVLGNSTALVSGELSYVQFDDGVRMIFRSYVSAVSAQTLYAHQETTSIAGTPYYTFKTTSADTSGITLSAQMSSSRVLLGKSVYSLQGVSSIPASTWTVNYRAWQDASPVVAFDSASSVEAATPATNVSWSHTTGAANNRLLVVTVNVYATTGTPTTVSSVTYGGVALTQVTTALYSTADPRVRAYTFRLVNPASGTKTIAVTFAASTLYVCGATTYTNVDQTTPIQTSQTATGSSTSPSVSVTATGTGRAVFGTLAGYRTAETSAQVTYVGEGTGSSSSSSGWPPSPAYPTPAYPSDLQANDLILLQVTVRDTTNTPTTPTGFTLLYGPDSTGTGRQWVYYKFATGTEYGTITITIGGTNCKMARMYAFRNVATSNFYEGGGFGSGTGRYISAQSVTTTGSNSLAVSFVFVNNDDSVGSFTGETGGDWTEAVSEFSATTYWGGDGCVQLQTATMASAGTISGGSYDMGYGVSDPWGVRAFALKPKTASSSQVTFQAAGTGSGTTGNPAPTYPPDLQADDLILLQVTVRDTYNTPTTPNGFTLLYGPDSTGTGRQWIYYKFATGSESGPLIITIGGYSCKIARMYSFRNVALSSFTEGGSFGSGYSSTVYAQSVTTTDTNRLAVSFLFVNDNNAVYSFTGETGGNWEEAVSEYTTSSGSDGCVQLQIATMPSAGTISGGSFSMNYAPWGVRAFALQPKTTLPSWTITESGQNNRWVEETYLYKGRGSDKLNVAAGPVTMSWSTDNAPNWVCSAVVINPFVPVGHCDIDVLIRKSDGTIRGVIAANVANSSNLTSTATTLSGTYSWGEYTVVDQTDYLEVDYYVAVAVTGSPNAYLRIDDWSLATSDQTRIAGVMLPSEYTSEVEFIGTSNTESWAQLVWTTDSNCSVAGVTVTTQLYNYTAGSYPTSGNGFKSAIIGTSDVTMTQNITTNPEDFRNSTGGWKLKFKAVSSSWFDLNIDLARYSPIPNYMLDIEEQWANVAYTYPRQDLCVMAGDLSLNESLMVDARVGSSWVTIIDSLQPNTWNNVSITQYIESSTFTIRFRDANNNSDSTPDSWNIDAVLLNPQPDIDTLLKSIDHVITVELLQNGTMRWLGQNFNLTTQEKPFPPVPVKAIHVNQTINGVNQEVPFQVEDWASNYRIPLGLTNNATVFGNKQMIVFLIDVNVSKVTIWWDGSDTATQTPNAYTNVYFTGDDQGSNRLTNGKLTLQFGSSFSVTLTVGSVSSITHFMRINNEGSTYGADLAYVIHHGVVRDILHQEAEWGKDDSDIGGANGCPNVYASIVLTLPAKATYYTYQLRLMFIDSTQPRTITNFYPLNLTTSPAITQLQTENGTVNGIPIVANGSGSFSSSVWAHHWSQFISSNQGAGIMFTNASNQQLYVFDPIAGTSTGALRADNSTRVIELLPVSLAPVSFNNALDVTWHGAVATFDSNATPMYTLQGTAPTGLWLLVEYPPKVTVTSES